MTKSRMGYCISFAASAICCALLGCGSPEPNENDTDRAGIVMLTLPGGTGAASVNIAFTGATRTVRRCLPIDAQGTQRLERLPTGSVVVTAEAYASTDCTGDAIYAAEPQTSQMGPGQPTAIQIVFKPNGIAIVSATIESDSPIACPQDRIRVPREAMASSASDPGGTGLVAVYDDGDTRHEGPIDFGPYVYIPGGGAPSYYPADVLADNTSPAFWRSIWSTGGETLTGYIIGPRTGPVTFSASADDYISMNLGNGLFTMVSDNQGDVSGTVQLQSGVYYPVTITYQNRWGSNFLRFYWQCP